MPRYSKRTKRLLNTRPAKLAGLVVLAVLILTILEVADITHFFHKSAVPPVIPVANSSQGSSQTQPNQNPTQKQPQASDKNNSSSSSSGQNPKQTLPLNTPYGDFVSNHHPGENGAPTSEVSVCNTTPGANCYIKFTKGTITTGLPSKTTGSDGSATWYWNIKDAKLTSGDWEITAIATLNGQTKSASDQLPLTIK